MYQNIYDPNVLQGNLLQDSDWCNMKKPINDKLFILKVPQIFHTKYC